MSKHGLNEKTVAQIAEVLARFQNVEKAVLFGSRAKGTHKPGSDIDLALSGQSLDWRVLGRIDDALDDLLLPYCFSVIIFDERTDPAVAAHIRRVGIPFFQRESRLVGK
jgi:uncharacterized protein